jgi:hypothetical protein
MHSNMFVYKTLPIRKSYKLSALERHDPPLNVYDRDRRLRNVATAGVAVGLRPVAFQVF